MYSSKELNDGDFDKPHKIKEFWGPKHFVFERLCLLIGMIIFNCFMILLNCFFVFFKENKCSKTVIP